MLRCGLRLTNWVRVLRVGEIGLRTTEFEQIFVNGSWGDEVLGFVTSILLQMGQPHPIIFSEIGRILNFLVVFPSCSPILRQIPAHEIGPLELRGAILIL